jgi:hypothetical protein
LNLEPPDELGEFSYGISGVHDDSGYVIYGPNGKRIEPWQLVVALNSLIGKKRESD